MAPGFATGIGVGLWLKLLVQNSFRVSPRYLGRAAAITGMAALNSCVGALEQLRYGSAIRRARPPAPLFVLGLPRSGTTHLHNLLSQDDRFGFPNTYQAMNPRIFLLTESWLAPQQQKFLPETRPMDNVRWGMSMPAEDEFAIMGLSGLSPFGSSLFPRGHSRYDRHYDLSEASPQERRRWQQALLHFLKKLHVRDERPLILKSPAHTARIPLLLEMFPDARFVCIHRHPYDVYVSGIHTVRKALPVSALQCWDTDELSRGTEQAFRMMLDAYFEHRHRIPEGRLVEVEYRQVEQSPLETLRRIYEALSLPEFATAEPAFAAYISSLEGYRKNRFADVDPEVKVRLQREWRRCFKEWGYDA
ncbi:MAG: sulfotransferase [Planctomycetaceae bacterium]|nr:sulfotransferase [Planctomycetaceae bacterium]